MRRSIAGGLAAIAAALAATGAAPVPAPANTLSPEKAAEAAFAKMFPTPRLYRMTMTRSWGGGSNSNDMCMGAEFMGSLMRDEAQRPHATPSSATGCTLIHKTHPDGSFYYERTCNKQAGAARTMHLVMEGTSKDMRQHIEFVQESSPSEEPRIVSTDMHSVDIGPCPANLKPGQIRGPSGQIIDPMADMAKRSAEAKARKDGSPVK
jgi:hypothetical protein